MRVIWVTGLPGSGKTTFSRKLLAALRTRNLQSVLLDGDDLRAAFNDQFGYSKEERIEASKVYVNLAQMLAKQGVTVIVSTVSLFEEVFVYLNAKIPAAKVIFMDASSNILDLRNQKQLRSVNSISSPGITLQVDFPSNPTMRLRGEETDEELMLILERICDLIQ